MAAGDRRASKFKDGRDDHCRCHRDGARADRGSHGIGDVVGADTPGHEHAQHEG